MMLLCRKISFLGLLVLGFTSCATAVIRTPREEVARFPIFDAHSHNSPTKELKEAMSVAGIKRMNIFRREDESGAGAVQLAREYPEQFVLSYRPPIEEVKGPADDAGVERIRAGTEKALKSGLYRGVGEITAYRGGRSPSSIAPDSKLIRAILELAGNSGVPVNIHCDTTGVDAMDRLLRAYPKNVVIWAHAGSYLSPPVITDFLRKHPNLYFDLSAKHPPFTSRRSYFEPILILDVISGNWGDLFESHPDRFLVGFDFGTLDISTPFNAAQEAGEFFRTMLMQLTPGTARKIAYENAERLYKLQ